VDLNVAVRQAAGFIEGEVKRRQVRLRLELAPGLPMIVGDRILIQQVLLNLAVNGLQAMEACPSASPELTLRTHRQTDGRLEISVGDTGGGVPPEFAEKLFVPYFTTKPHGLGMGLSISRSIVESMNGQLWMEPNQPEGALFRIQLPVATPR
jgi:C4-dicarboxylate-specific signal transduction histidine kinase